MKRYSSLIFYFDYLSPYAYFAWQSVGDFCQKHELQLKPKPIVFAKVLDHWGQLGPAEIPPKREWVFKTCYRYANQHGIPFQLPRYHPFNPLPALRLSLAEVSAADQQAVISAIFSAGWEHGLDIGDLSTLSELLAGEGLNSEALMAAIQAPSVKQKLAKNTAEALSHGVFGVPSFVIGNELFWGNDQFESMADFVAGRDPCAGQVLESLLGHRGVVARKR